MKKVVFFLFLLAFYVAYGQSDRVFMFVKTTAPTDTVYMMRDDIDTIFIERNCLQMAPSWIPKRDRLAHWNAPNRLNQNETFDVYYHHLNRWEPIMTKSIYSSCLFDKEIVVDSCSSFNEKLIFYHGLTFDDARGQIRQMTEEGKTSDLLLYGKDIIDDLIALLDDSTGTHIPMPHCNATYNYGDVALMSLLRIVRLPVSSWLNVEKDSLYYHLHLHPEVREVLKAKAKEMCQEDTTAFGRFLFIPHLCYVKDSTYQADFEGNIFHYRYPERYDYFTIMSLGTEWPAASLANNEVISPSRRKLPSYYHDVLGRFEIGFEGDTLTYIVLCDEMHIIITENGEISTSSPLPAGYPIKDVNYVEDWGYYMPVGKGWYARFSEYPKEGAAVGTLFQYGF